MRETYDPQDPNANRAAFAVDPPNFEYRTAVALMFAIMYCVPILSGVIAILTARTVLRAPVAITKTAYYSSWVAIVLGAGNIGIWTVFFIGKLAGWWGPGDIQPTTVPV